MPAARRRDLLAAVAIRIAAMAAQLGVVAVMRTPGQGSAVSRLRIWDGLLYAQVAAHGYPHAVVVGADGQLVSGTQFAFFPLYPALTWLLSHVTGLGYADAGLAVALACSCLLGPLAFAVAERQSGSRRAGYLAAVLVGLLPMAVVFEMAYAEALFTALSFAAYACAQRGRWGRAGVLLLLAGLTRPVGYVVTAGVLALGLGRWWRDGRSRRELGAVLGAGALGFVAAPAFWTFCALRTRDATAWFDVQRAGWGTTFDRGASTYAFVRDQVLHATSLSEAAVPCAAVLLGYLLLVGCLLVGCVARRALAPYAVIAALGWATVALSSNYWHSKPRLLLECALLLVPVAGWLARQNVRVVATLLVFAACADLWFGAYMITQWPYAI